MAVSAALAPILEADGIGRSFGRKVVLKAAGFAVRPGRITALMGRNGVGKTTLLKIMAGTLRSDYGAVRFKGHYVHRPSLALMAREGLMFNAQDSVLIRHRAMRSHFRAFTQIFGGEERVDEVVSELRVGDLWNRRASDLSGGERQRVSLALTMLRSPLCLLMDEPFAGVAPIDVPLVSQALLRLKEQGVAVAISGHDVNEIFGVSDQIIWMVGGTTHWIGSPEQAQEHFQFRKEYLGSRAGRGWAVRPTSAPEVGRGREESGAGPTALEAPS